MSNKIWNVVTHHETPAFGAGDYDEYYEIVNERGDAIQTTDNFDNLHVIADALNSFDGELRITTALEINLHCDNQLLKMENEKLRAENSKMRNALEEIAAIGRQDEIFDIGGAVFNMAEIANESLNKNV